MKVALIDNYDSFSHNLADAVRRAGARVEVHRNDAITPDELNADAIILSPGPGHPANARDFGICTELIRQPLDVPMLGVCLGMQGMALHTGGEVGPAPQLVHGESDDVRLAAHGAFNGLEQPVEVGRYHSLCVTAITEDWQELGRSRDGTLMAMSHRHHPWLGVQFHPESILTPQGQTMIEQFLSTC